MTSATIEPAQQTAARVAGALYLVINAIQLFAEIFLRAPLLVAGDAARTAERIVASETQFRLSIVSLLLVVAGEVALLVALYVVLKPINRNLALLAAFWRLTKAVIFALATLNDFVGLSLLSGAEYLRVFDTKQLQALARMFLTFRHTGGLIGAVFLGLGSAVFAWLWWKSRYIPRGLAAWGILSSLLMAMIIPTTMVLPDLTSVFGPAYWAPLFIFELILGVWLLVKGIRVPERA
jgi:uncharacterized protein DUF4386